MCVVWGSGLYPDHFQGPSGPPESHPPHSLAYLPPPVTKCTLEFIHQNKSLKKVKMKKKDKPLCVMLRSRPAPINASSTLFYAFLIFCQRFCIHSHSQGLAVFCARPSTILFKTLSHHILLLVRLCMKASTIATTTKVIAALFSHPTIITTTNAFRRPSLARRFTSSLLLTLDEASLISNTTSYHSTNTTATSASSSKKLHKQQQQQRNQTRFSTTINNNTTNKRNSNNMSSIQSMQRGHNGRIEEAFAKCKERGEAAFVTFVTAGFPVKEGEII